MPYKTTRVQAEMYLSYNGVNVYHCYNEDDIRQAESKYHFVLDKFLNLDKSFDIRNLSTWREDRARHAILKLAIDSGELKPYKPLD